jgi:hypothetical protein
MAYLLPSPVANCFAINTDNVAEDSLDVLYLRSETSRKGFGAKQ